MNKLQNLTRIADIVVELHTYNKLTRWQKIQNFFRKLFKKKLIENLVIPPERKKVLERRVRKLSRKLNG